MKNVETPTEAPIVETKQGKVSGLARPSSFAYFGIPYAQAPIGPLAFADPQPPKAWEGLRDGRLRGATGLLHTVPGTLVPEPARWGSNVLNLDVYTPEVGEAAKLPVFVWIHGGGFIAGSPAGSWYDGRGFNARGAVVVAISYRLGFEGFGYVPGRPLNRGMADWVAALKWVQENIAAFGGDPGRVTIGGQSAGGTAVLTLFAAPGAQGLFHGGWAASPASALMPEADARKIGAKLANLLGVENTAEGFEGMGRERIYATQSEAGKTDARGLNKLQDLRPGTLPYGPVLDGETIGESINDSYLQGVGTQVPLVVGSTTDEFTFIMDKVRGPLTFVPKNRALSFLGADDKQAAGYIQALASEGVTSTATVAGRYLTDSIFRSTVLSAAQARFEGSNGQARTWVYSFEWPTPTTGQAMHCIDLPFLFNCLGDEDVPALLGTRPPQTLADTVHDAAVRFIDRQDEPWPTWSPSNPVAQVFDEGARLGETLTDTAYTPAAHLL